MDINSKLNFLYIVYWKCAPRFKGSKKGQWIYEGL